MHCLCQDPDHSHDMRKRQPGLACAVTAGMDCCASRLCQSVHSAAAAESCRYFCRTCTPPAGLSTKLVLIESQ